MGTPKDRPNILFLLSDQHNPHILGSEGDRTVDTPSLDRLAAEGVVFANAYCQNPLCVPSRCSLITGRYSRNLGIYDNKHILESNCETIPRVLAARGYRTCLIGKGHFNGEQWQGYQQRPYGDLYGQAHQPNPRRSDEPGNLSGLGGFFASAGPSRIPIALTQTEICVAESVKWLQAHRGLHPDQPFFLSVHFDKPHFPITPPPAYFEKYRGRVALPSGSSAETEGAVPFVQLHRRRYEAATGDERLRALAAYYGCVEWVDDAVGRILESLDYLGLAENTLVIYSSDHGEMAEEHRLWQKSVFYEAAARVPLVFRWPGSMDPCRCESPVGLIDLFPTICEAAGCQTPDSCDGTSLLPLCTGDGALARDHIFSESVMLNHPDQAGCMIRTGKWKYCSYLDGSQELYDLDRDPGEFVNLARGNEHGALVHDLAARVQSFWDSERQIERYRRTPRMQREKHFYEFSNQFVVGDGAVVDARP